MRADELRRGSVFSTDGGETWLVVMVDPRDADDADEVVVLAAPVDRPTLGASVEMRLGWHDHIWEPDPEALNRGDEHLPVREDMQWSKMKLCEVMRDAEQSVFYGLSGELIEMFMRLENMVSDMSRETRGNVERYRGMRDDMHKLSMLLYAARDAVGKAQDVCATISGELNDE